MSPNMQKNEPSPEHAPSRTSPLHSLHLSLLHSPGSLPSLSRADLDHSALIAVNQTVITPTHTQSNHNYCNERNVGNNEECELYKKYYRSLPAVCGFLYNHRVAIKENESVIHFLAGHEQTADQTAD